MYSLKISAKDLGNLKMDGFCPRCFWIERHMELPYQRGFPGIFSSIDTYTKRMVKHHFERTGSLPEWLKGIGDVDSIISIPKGFFVERRGVRLTGIPDEIFRSTDGDIIIVDYKTARYTDRQDSFFPMYEIQLNGYAYIAESLLLGGVKSLYLVYFEPPSGGFEELSREHVNGYGFDMPFKPNLRRVRKDTGEIEALMGKALKIYSMEGPPKGLYGCDDCRRLEDLQKLPKRAHQ